MINIRNAKIEDAELILSLIKDLAEFEKLSESVIASVDDIRKNVFGENKSIFVLIAEYDNYPVGFALFFHNFSTFLGKPGIYLEDLFVKQEYRNKGIGKKLLQEIAKIAVDKDCGRFEWSVLTWNPARKFYEYLGAKAMDEWYVYRIEGESLKKLAEIE